MSEQAVIAPERIDQFQRDGATVRRLIFESALGRTVGELMRSRIVRLYHDHILTKEAGTRQLTPWHQDQPYYNISGRQNISFWIPVDLVSCAGTLEFIAGSHRGRWLMPRTFMDAQAKWFPAGSLGGAAQHRRKWGRANTQPGVLTVRML